VDIHLSLLLKDFLRICSTHCFWDMEWSIPLPSCWKYGYLFWALFNVVFRDIQYLGNQADGILYIYISIVIHLCLACGCWWNYINCYPFMFSMWLLMGLYPLLYIDVLSQWLLYPFVAHGYCTLFSSVGRKTDSGGVTLLTK
jgi:hypothetical protein